jgi:serine/threonine-protein kinase
MAEQRAGFPAKTAKLEKTSPDSADADPSASSSSFEMLISEDVGRTISGRYEITDVIGEGGMGVVYEAYDAQVDRKVAIKLVRAECATDRKYLSRFRRELEITSQLRHPSTIRVFEHGTTEDRRPYMVMELLTGESLADRLERGRVDEMEALQIARQVAESLSEAHEHGVFHRDLKPDNIFIEKVGVSTVVKVLDFGIAGGVDARRLTQAGEVFGTPQYMSPEQCNGLPLDHRTDVYSLGCILHEMIEGRPPFSAESPMATMLKHVRAKLPPLRHASKGTAKLLKMTLRKDRSKRIQTAARLAQLVGECIGALRSQRKGGRPAESSGVITMPGGSTTDPFSPVPVPVALSTALNLGATPEERRGKTIAILLAVAAFVLIVAMVFGDLGGAPPAPEVDDPREAADRAAADARPAERPSEGEDRYPNNRALITSSVPGATVRVDGVSQCETPCEIKIPVGDDRSHEIRLSKEGYMDAVTNWKPLSVSDSPPPMPPMQPLE